MNASHWMELFERVLGNAQGEHLQVNGRGEESTGSRPAAIIWYFRHDFAQNIENIKECGTYNMYELIFQESYIQ